MAKRFKLTGGERRAPKSHGLPAASAETDSESGNEGAGSGDTDLYALNIMRERGLISEEDYRRRKAKIEAQNT